METLELSNEQLNNLKYFDDGSESKIYLFEENGQKKVIKIFLYEESIENKIRKIKLIKERTKNCNFVVNAEKLVSNNGNIIGYTMPKIERNASYYFSKNTFDDIIFLKDLAKKIKQLNELGIICADFFHNYILDKDNNIYLIDCDNFAIDDLEIDIKNEFYYIYNNSVNKFDKNFDTYILNLFTIAKITNFVTSYIIDNYKRKSSLFRFKDKIINDIVKNTFELKDEYNEQLILDQINCKKDLIKIRRRLF